MTVRIGPALVLAISLLIASCSAGRSVPPAEVSGTVTFRERIALVPGTQLRVTLSETTRADAPAQFIAETTVPDVLGVPVPDRKSTRLNSSHLGISYAVF